MFFLSVKFKRIALAFVLSLTAGCMSSPGGLTSSTVPITSKDSYVIVQKDVVGTDWSFGFLNIPIPPLSAYSALQRAKKKNEADGLINVTCKNQAYWISLLPIVTYHRTVIRGDAIKFIRGAE